MPTNDERREVAARLRKHAKTARRVGYACVLKNCTSEEECDGFGTEGCEGCFSKSLKRLADLIEPEPSVIANITFTTEQQEELFQRVMEELRVSARPAWRESGR